MDKPKQTGARMSAETLIARNAKLMREFSIETPEDLKEALGDLYHNQETRKALLDRLSEKNRILLRDFYYHNCPAGLDRFPACVKVTIGKKTAVLGWFPYEADVTEAVRRKLPIDVTVVGTRTNIFSPLHETAKPAGLCAPESFLTEGDRWTDDYSLLSSGLRGFTFKFQKRV